MEELGKEKYEGRPRKWEAHTVSQKQAMTFVVACFLPFFLPQPAIHIHYTHTASATTFLTSKCEPEVVAQPLNKGDCMTGSQKIGLLLYSTEGSAITKKNVDW